MVDTLLVDSWRRGLGGLLTSLLMGLLFCASAMCEETAHADESAHEEHERNVIGLFLGVSGDRRDNGLAIGIDYKHRFGKSFGIGAVVEHTFGDLDVSVFAVPFVYYTGPWAVYLAPGVEDSDEGRESLIRIGAEYGFEVGTWEIAPQVDIDFVDGDKVAVVGATFGKRF